MKFLKSLSPDNEKLFPIAKGVVKSLPGMSLLLQKNTGGTIDSRYCYNIWLRHLVKAQQVKEAPFLPATVAEIGPGDSLGIGLAALLSGVEQYYALDVIKYWDIERNLLIFDALVELFKEKAAIPDEKEYPFVKPLLGDYAFPSYILTEQILEKALDEDRLKAIRWELENLYNPDFKHQYIHCLIPWYDAEIIKESSVDMILSQAVLEHIEDLEKTYLAMSIWLKPGGISSHQIDFKSHGITKSWNGHWTFKGWEWKLVKAGKKFLINRAPCSRQVQLSKKYGFAVTEQIAYQRPSAVNRAQLAVDFKNLSEQDLQTSELYVQAVKSKVAPTNWKKAMAVESESFE